MFGDQMLAAPVTAPARQDQRPGHGKSLAAPGRVDRVAHGQALHRAGHRRAQLLHRPDARLPARRRDRAHAAAHALHRRKAGRPADRERLAARAGHDRRPTRSMKTQASRSSISAASLPARPSRPRRPATRCASRSARWRAAIRACCKTRGYELRLPADWPPASVTVNGVAVKQAGAGQGRMDLRGQHADHGDSRAERQRGRAK